MTESQKMLWGGGAMIVVGAGFILFGGSHTTSESWFELFGFRFGRGESEPMSRGQCWFYGIAFIVGGIALIKFSPAA